MPDYPLLNERQLLAVLSTSKDATAIYATDELRIQFANDAMLAFWGKDRSIIGMPLAEGVPELQGQPFAATLRAVLHSGITHRDRSVPAEISVDDRLQTRYYAYVYEPVKNDQGETLAVLHTAS